MTRAEIVAGLKAGRTLVVYHKDTELLSWLREQEREGHVTSKRVRRNPEASAWEFRYRPNAARAVARAVRERMGCA